MSLILVAALLPTAAGAQAVDEQAAREIALKKEPGEVIKTVITKTKTETIYDFTVKNAQGTIFGIEVDGRSGRVTGHEIDYAATAEALPRPLVLEGDAKAIAIRHVQESSPGRRKPVVTGVKYKTEQGRPVYKVDMRQGFDSVTVFVDAQSGEVVLPGELLGKEVGR